MQTHLLRKIFAGLKPAEHRRLERFLDSPYHVTHADVPALYRALRRLDASGVDWQSRAIYETAYPGRPYDPGSLHHRASWLFKAVEDFLALEAWQAEGDGPALALQRAYNDRRLEAAFRHAHALWQRTRAKATRRDAERLRFDYALAWEHYRYEVGHAVRTDATRLTGVARALDTAFAAEKLRLACLDLSRRAVGGPAEPEPDVGDLLPAVLARVEADAALRAEPAVGVYYHAYRALSSPAGESDFELLKQALVEHAAAFPQAELQALVLLAINFCIRRLNTGETRYFRETFELYRAGLSTAVLLEGGRLSRFTYNNIVVIGLRLGEHAWVRRFIDDYAAYLEPAERAATVHFNLGKYYYESGQYAEAQAHLVQRAYDDPLHNLAARVLLAKMYYRNGAWDALDSLLDALELYLRRQKNLGYHRANYRNFVRAMRQLLHTPASERPELRTAWTALEPLTERDWLLQQL
jgi:hypothetical protein